MIDILPQRQIRQHEISSKFLLFEIAFANLSIQFVFGLFVLILIDMDVKLVERRRRRNDRSIVIGSVLLFQFLEVEFHFDLTRFVRGDFLKIDLPFASRLLFELTMFSLSTTAIGGSFGVDV